ncbi:hypothetical protein N7577_07465 [Enterobacter roggenkampii]|nr:hypothetical protein [Enterobacter roggenkampii]MDG9878076.1 hypothetical protein [Enterobacter roggenkampii]
MGKEEDKDGFFLIVLVVLTFLFSVYIGLTIYNEKPAKCQKTDTCNSVFR